MEGGGTLPFMNLKLSYRFFYRLGFSKQFYQKKDYV